MSHDQDGHLYDNGEGLRYCLCTCRKCNNEAGACCCPDEDREACGMTHGPADGSAERRLQVQAYYLQGKTLVKAYEGISEIVARESIPEGAEYALVSMEWTPGFDAAKMTVSDTRPCKNPDKCDE